MTPLGPSFAGPPRGSSSPADPPQESSPCARPVVVSCEHGGNHVPEEWQELFLDDRELLESHRGWDPGSREVAEALADSLGAPLHLHLATRLLVDLNRSPHHPRLFGERVRQLPPEERERMVDRVYRPHRDQVEKAVRTAIERRGRLLHVSVHTFTPVLDGRRRPTGVGLLYDAARPAEREAVEILQRHLRAELPELRIHRNRPYRGTADGLTTLLRNRFDPPDYQGIEVEVRSDLVQDRPSDAGRIGRLLAEGIAQALS